MTQIKKMSNCHFGSSENAINFPENKMFKQEKTQK